jgi:hypothetical protein
MWNSIGSWLCIMGLVIGPFSVGVFFEEKLQRAHRELGSRLLRRYQKLPPRKPDRCSTKTLEHHPVRAVAGVGSPPQSPTTLDTVQPTLYVCCRPRILSSLSGIEP